MKMKKSQLKEAVKTVVRQCLNERLAKEGCGGGKKRFAGKAGRMFGHVEKSEKEQGKSTKVAKKIAGATVNKKLKEQLVGPVADEGMGADSKQTPMDDIVKFVIRKVPAITNNPQKVASVAGLLFQKQFGGQPPDPETLLGLVQKHLSAGHAPEGQDECGSMQDEAGLTSETGEEAAMMPVGNMSGGEEGGEGYDEKEEIMLIKVMALIAKKLEAMHAGMPGDESDPAAACPAAAEEPSEPSASPFGGGEEEPSEEPSDDSGEENPFASDGPEEPEEPSEEPEDEEPEKPEKKKKEPPIKEVSAKTQTQGYRVAPNPSTFTQKTDTEKLKPNDPRLTETSKIGMKMGPQYKTVSPRQARVTSDDQARTIQFDPKMTEAAKKKMKENHKVQTRSYKTFNDMDNDPNNVRDPEIPQA